MNKHDHKVSAEALEKVALVLEGNRAPFPGDKSSEIHHQSYINILRGIAEHHREEVAKAGVALCLVH